MESPTIVHPRRPRAREAWSTGPGADALALDRYRLRERLGAGGFGVVWSARDETLDRDVAVKRIPLSPGDDGERATREALASARLAHPAIVALYEACPTNEAFYLISELVDGDTLAELIADDALADSEILQIGVALCSALAHAHERGVIHRDVKPQNVLVPHGTDVPEPVAEAFGGVAKLTDFGGAQLSGQDVLTRTGDVLGTLAYMAPEQSEGREVGEEADLYSLALVLYEALSGVNPVRGATPAETVRRIGRALPSLARTRRNTPRRLAAALDRALDPSPHARGTLDDLRDALEQALADGPTAPTRRMRARAQEAARERPSQLAHEEAHQDGGRSPLADERLEPLHGLAHALPEPARRPARRGLPRLLWLAATVAIAVWQVSAGRAGVALLALAALLPIVALPIGRRDHAGTGGWLACVLAPALGVVGLAGAFPAIAGQAPRWRMRAALGALGYWWLALAEPLLERRLWLGPAPGTRPRTGWEGSFDGAAVHAIGPLLGVGLLLGAALWASGAVLLPLIVRGRNAALDAVAAVVWSALLVAAAPLLDSGLAAHAAHASPRGAILGGVLGGTAAVAARALRGPV
ncbi:MAG TPA: serine/threonine-protein kinase [Solirubrobacteraceae bacterium]|nr:serine/threonine-protein kinase [Solirubrobacteraceae bacterium]